MHSTQRVTLVSVALMAALIGAYVWTGWVHADHGLATFVVSVLLVATVGLITGLRLARREGPRLAPPTGR